MSLSFAAIVPHSPLLIPSVSRDNIQQVSVTVEAIKKLAKQAATEQIETFIIITTHNPVTPDSYLINHCPKLKCNFEEFGDLVTNFDFDTDIELSYKIREYLETKKQLSLICEDNLHYAVAVPMYYLTEQLPKAKLIPIHTSNKTLQDHFELGKLIRHILNLSAKKIGVIVSGDLSHTLNKNSPGGFSPAGKEFDDMILRILKNNDTQLALDMQSELINDAEECILKPLIILLGMLAGSKNQAEILVYESPFAVGWLTAKYNLN